jgi:CheY-like chemotaxis protein
MKPLDRNKELSNLIESHRNISSAADFRRLLKAGGYDSKVTWTALATSRPHERSANEFANTAPIFVVDDEPGLTELYSIVLEARGYIAKPFNDRVEALLALKSQTPKPALLIMDYLGHPMSTERFMERCRIIHPGLRILLASGFHQLDRRLTSIKADAFIQKPFTAEAFLREVRATMVK